MIAFLNQLAEIGGLNALIFLVLFLFAIREGYNFCVWVKTEILDKYHKKSQRTENVEERFEELKVINQKEDKEIGDLKQEFASLKDQMGDIKNQYTQWQAKDIEYHLAIVRNTLYHIYSKCCKNGYIDQAEYECFEKLKMYYLNNNGNSIFKHKVIPYIDSLEVKGIDFNPEDIKQTENRGESL